MAFKRDEVKYIIYGAGEFGKRLYYFFDEYNIKIDYFCQTDKCANDDLYGIPLISLDELRKVIGLKIIFIAINDHVVSEHIKFKLANLLSDEDEILECGDFINFHLPESGSRKLCIICKTKVKGFLPGGHIQSLFDKCHIIGDGFRKNCYCPVCGCSDRERWCFEVIKEYTNILESKCTVLHIAPENGIRNRILHNELCDYYAGDIDKKDKKTNTNIVDVTNIQYKNDFFDFIIINHVLEHVPDIIKAVNELKRVLKKDGKIIMSFPICMDSPTIEDNSYLSDEERIDKFGQADRVRLFGYDYMDKLKQLGLSVEVYTPMKKYTESINKKYGFTYNDIILICTNTNNPMLI